MCFPIDISAASQNKSILVHGILGFSKETLELFFESKKKCDGDDIESITICEEDDEALITYYYPEGKCTFSLRHQRAQSPISLSSGIGILCPDAIRKWY